MIYTNIMKYIFLFSIIFLLPLSVNADTSFFTDLWNLPFCNNNECSYQSWLEAVKWLINNMVINKTLSEFIQDVIIYLLSFISIIAVIYIIYAWFSIMIWWWNDEAIKKAKKTIIHVIVWIIIIWLSYSIVSFIINILDTSSS